MIHVIEINESNQAYVWFAFDQEDFIRKLRIDRKMQPDKVIYRQTTAQQLLAIPQPVAGMAEALAEQRLGHPALSRRLSAGARRLPKRSRFRATRLPSRHCLR